MSGREIITIQMGHYANFVGAHWWNLQEANFSYDPAVPTELNNDILFREGENYRKEITFTPRALIVDLKGSLGHLSEQGTLYDDQGEFETAPGNLWDPGKFSVTSEDPPPKNPFVKNLEGTTLTSEKESYDFENDVDSWVDFLVPKFHPRTVNVIKEYKHKCTDSPFDVFHYGKNVWKTEQFQEDFSDKIRAYAEECDWLQGFQVLLDSCNAFGGLGTSCIEYLHDEYGRSILAFPLIESQQCKSPKSSVLEPLNTGLCYQELGESASLFVPLCCTEDPWARSGIARKFPHLNYNKELKYHTSALMACALETISVRYRHKEHTMSSLSDLCADMNKLGRKAAAMSLSLPFPIKAQKDLIDLLDDMDGSKKLWTSLTPNVEISGDKCMQSIALRGIPETRLKRPIAEAKLQMNKAAYRCSSVHEMMTMHLAYSCHASATYLTNINTGLDVSVPFPTIFTKNVHGNGDIAAGPVAESVKKVAVLAGIHSTPEMSGLFDSLHTKISEIKNVKKLYYLGDSGLEQDEFVECLNHLQDCQENYQDHYV